MIGRTSSASCAARPSRWSHELIAVWPRDTRFAQRCFELLRQAYVNARYSPHYKVTPAELEWLAERVALLQQLVKHACEARLASG